MTELVTELIWVNITIGRNLATVLWSFMYVVLETVKARSVKCFK